MSAATDRRDLLTTVATETAGAVGDAFLIKLVESVGSVFGGGVCWVSELVAGRDAARALACWPSTALPPGEEYPLEGTPCQLVHEQAVVAYVQNVAGEFPTDDFLTLHGLDGYLALPCKDSAGAITGYLAITTRLPLAATGDELAALKVFASWVGEEIERRLQESLLRAREAELMASRARVVEAADEERRRIGRDLHDGVQQRLVALTQRVDVALRALDRGDTEQATDVLRDARDQATATNRELRELAQGLHPAGLTEHGLENALRVLGSGSELPLRVTGLPDRRLPAAIELTVYYLVSEALTNAVKYAQASELVVTGVLGERALRVVVSDDGVGGAVLGQGSGLQGLCERVGALGGAIELSSPPGEGTRMVANIPLAPFRVARDPFLEFGYEGDDGLGKRLIAETIAGRKQCTISLAREWDLEGGPPQIGQKLPIQDHTGVRHATVAVTRTALMPFGLVDEGTARAATGQEHITIAEWRSDRHRFYSACREEIAALLGEPSWHLTEDEPMVITWFALTG